GTAIAAAALTRAGLGVVALDLGLVARDQDPVALATVAGREGRRRRAGLVAGPVEALAEASLEALHRLSRWDIPVLYVGTATWDTRWGPRTPLAVDVPLLGAHDRVELWREHLGAHHPSLEPEVLAAHLALGPSQVSRAVRAAEASALLTGGPVTPDDLRRGVRAQNAAGLARLARRVRPGVGWPGPV